MVAPVGAGEGTAVRPAGPDHGLDRVDPRGGEAPRPRVPAAWGQERWEEGGRRALPGSVAVGAGGAEGWASTAPSRGLYGSLGAIQAAESA